MRVRIDDVTSTLCFLESGGDLLQVVHVRVHASGWRTHPFLLSVGGPLASPAPVPVDPAAGAEQTVEIGLRGWGSQAAGTSVPVIVRAHHDGGDLAAHEAEVVTAEPGWTLFLVPHFHYDPVWWNTQAAYTTRWDDLPDAQSVRGEVQQSGFDLVRAHTDAARRDPDYRFVLAELDYLKPYWDAFPEERDTLRGLLAEGRLELIGGTYNEPNTNLTNAESTIRNAVYGIGFQRDVMGGAPETAWQLDVFGHDPQFPGLMAAAGLAHSSWARGPYHQWGPIRSAGADVRRMEFASEFRWLSPSGDGLVTSYMADHYGSGWDMASATSLAEAQSAIYDNFVKLASVAATRNVLMPVGTDYTPPTHWVTEAARDWNARYASPRFECALARDFFAAVRRDSRDGAALWPQTRDMNPIYTGKDVSYIDIKQAQRAAEDALVDAETFATLAGLLTGARYPEPAFDLAWRQLAFGAHHDGITGSFSDQVYLDLLTGWRQAYDLATTARDRSVAAIASVVDTRSTDTGDRPVVVFNSQSWPRTELASVDVRLDPGLAALVVVDDSGTAQPTVTEHEARHPDGTLASARLTFLARDVPGVGHRTYWLRPTDSAVGWSAVEGNSAECDGWSVEVDPDLGGGITSLRCGEIEFVRPGGLGNEFRLYAEHRDHPQFGEGPWHLIPRGPVTSSAESTAAVVVATSPIGQRVTARGSVGSLTYTTTLTLADGVDRVDVRTTVDGFAGADQLLRMRFAADLPGALPISETAHAVIGRGLGHPDVDTAEAPWTLDNPAYTWFGAGSTARVRIGATVRAIGVAEVVAPTAELDTGAVDGVVLALGRVGVTATVSSPERQRYGALDFDSNVPDVRIVVGGPDVNAFTAEVLGASDPGYTAEVQRQLDAHGRARVWIPARAPLTDVFGPNTDVRGARDLPVLLVVDDGPALVDDLRDATIEVDQDPALATAPSGEPSLTDRTLAVLNRGMPGFVVDPDGALHLSLFRSCTGWPSGVWIDPPKRAVPDGSGFQLQHWSHTFEYAFTGGAGDWRAQRIVHEGHSFNHRLLVQPSPQHDGAVAGAAPLVIVEPETAILSAFKAAGNPLSRGSQQRPDPRSEIAVRVYEAHGGPADVRVETVAPLRDRRSADALERSTGALEALRLNGSDVRTILARPDLPPAAGAEAPPLAPEHEPAQPVYTRYWLHNKGPAPMGYLPVAVHVQPSEVTGEGPFPLRLTVASDRTDDAVHTTLRVLPPPGWTSDFDDALVGLDAGGHATFHATVAPPAGAEPGLYTVAVRADSPDGQVVEDLVVVSLGEPADVATELTARIAADAVHAATGRVTEFAVELTNAARSELHGEIALISPWGTWPLVWPAAAGFSVPPGGSSAVVFRVDVPPGSTPSITWVLAKVMCAGRLVYTETVPLVVE